MSAQEKRKMIIINNGLCVFFVILSIAFSMALYGMAEDPIRDPMSKTGDENRILFALWGFSTSLAVFFNLHTLARRLNIRSHWFNYPLIAACIAGTLTTLVVGLDPLQRAIHIGSAAVFGIAGVLCLLFLLIEKAARKNFITTSLYILILLVVGLYFIISTLGQGWFTAQSQALLVGMGLFIMLAANFFEKWQVLTPQDEIFDELVGLVESEKIIDEKTISQA